MRKKKSLIIGGVCAALAIGTIFFLRAAANDPDRILARADKYFAEEAFDEARIEYFNVLKGDPGNARAIRQLGLVWMEMGAPIQAGMFLGKANETDPGDTEVGRELAKALFASNQFANARDQALAVLDKEPSTGDILVLLANASTTDEQLAAVSGRLSAFEPKSSVDFHLASAILASRKGEIEAAKASLDKALEADAQSVSAHLALATYCEATGNPDGKLDALAKASELAQPRSPARLRYARTLAQGGKPEEAKTLVREITETSRFYLPAWNLLAELTLQAEDPKGAMAMVNEVLGRDATNPDAHMLRAAVLQAEGKTDEATKATEDLNRIFPGNVGIMMTLAGGYVRNNDLVRAGATLDEILKLAPDHIEANLLQAQLNIRSGATIAAVNSLEKLLATRPGLEQAEFLLARAYQAEGQLDDAAGVFRKQIERTPEQAGPHFMLGMMLRQQGKADEALASFEKAQSLTPEDQAITFQLIDLDIARKDFASAHQRAAKQATLKPEDWGPLFLQGKVYSAEENWVEAEKSLLKALEIKPDSTTVYDLLIGGYIFQGRVPQAISQLEVFLEQNPKSTPQRLLVAMLSEKEGQIDKAAAAYEQILADNPDFVPALNNLAYLCAGPLNDLDRANTLAAKARSLQPNDPAVADTLGWILFKRKDYPEAITLLEEAAGKIPDNSEIQYHLGMARYMRGQKEAARTALEEALASGKPFPGDEEAKKYLALLAGEGGPEGSDTIEALTARLTETPGDVVTRVRLAKLQESAGDFADAAANYEQALKDNGSLVEALTGLARLYTGPLDDLTRGTEFARRARAVDGRNPAAARALGEAVLLAGDFRYAYNLLQEATRATNDDPALSLRFAEAAYGIGRVDEARAALQSLADAGADSAAAKEAVRFLILTGDATGPIAATVEETLQADPDSLPALMAKASLAGQKGNPAEAVGILEGVLERQPEFVPAQKALAALLATDAAKLDEAQRFADKARLALPDDPALARTLGLIRYGKGDPKAAARLLAESDAKSPLDAEGLYYLGMAHLKAEQQEDGVAALKRALADATLIESLRQEAEKALADAMNAPDHSEE